MSESDPITAAIEGAVAEATASTETVEATETESAAETADVAEGSADIEDGQEHAEAGVEPKEGKAEPEKGTVEAPKKKRGPIPYDRHEAVLTKARREAEAKQAELNQRIEALSKYETPEYQAQFKFLQLLENEPARAVEILRRVDPQRYAHLTWAEAQQQAREDVAAVATPAPNGKPEPDALLSDGAMGYSAEAQVKLLEWRLAQERTAYQKELTELRESVKPIRTEHEARVAYTQALDKMKPVLVDARQNWPGFAENEAGIREALENNPMWDLNAAYRSVVIPSFKADRTKLEAEIERKTIEKLNAKGKAKSLNPGQVPAAGATPSDGEVDTEDIIRRSIASLRESA